MGWNISMPTSQYVGHSTPSHEIERIVKELNASSVIAIDTETTGLVKWKDIPLYWSLAWGTQRATLHADMLPYFTSVFRNPNITWVLANAKYDMHILANVGHLIAGKWHDVQVMHALLFDDKPHKLKFIAKHILDWTWADFQDQFGKISVRQSPRQLIEKAERENFSLLVEYAANDAWGTLKVYEALKESLEREKTFSLFFNKPPYIETLWDFFSKIESPFTKTLWKMERRGIKVNKQRLEEARPDAEKLLQDIERKLVSLYGKPINVNSSPQIGALCESLGLKPIKWSNGGKTGVRKPSWDADVLKHYANEHEEINLILQHRQYSKLLGTYINGLHDLLDPYDRIHSNFNQDVARTGRLSSSDPNLQNIPRSENDHWNLRGAFITEPGWKVIAADYSQLEMRLLAAAAQEQPMVDIFLRNWDIHAGNAALMFSMEYEDINASKDLLKKMSKLSTSDALAEAEAALPGVSQRAASMGSSVDGYLRSCAAFRSAAKNIGFGLNYGMGPAKLARDLNVSLEEAKEKIAQYKATYTAVDRFMKEAVEEAKTYGYAYTVMGRRRWVGMIASRNKGDQALGERLAVNHQIQGSAADVVRVAQVNIDCCALDRIYDCHSILQVHDELVFEVPEGNVQPSIQEIEELMAHPFYEDLLCPLIAEAGVGDSWGDAK